MAAVGPDVAVVSWFLSPGPVSFLLLLLLLSIFLTALCSDCRRHSFDLQDSDADKNPSNLIRVVKLEEALEVRENPEINEIQRDEDAQTNGSEAVKKTTAEPEPPEEEIAFEFTPWRSHLSAPQIHDSTHIYDIIESKLNSSPDVSSLPTNQLPEETADTNQTYARVSKKARPATPSTTPPVFAPEEVQEEGQSLPPLPHREAEPEG